MKREFWRLAWIFLLLGSLTLSFLFAPSAFSICGDYNLIGTDPDEGAKVDIKDVYAWCDETSICFKIITHRPWGKNVVFQFLIDADMNPNTGGDGGFDYSVFAFMEDGNKALAGLFDENNKVVGGLLDCICEPNANVFEVNVPLKTEGIYFGLGTYDCVKCDLNDVAPNKSIYKLPSCGKDDVILSVKVPPSLNTNESGTITAGVKDSSGGSVADAKVTAKTGGVGGKIGPFTYKGNGIYEATYTAPSTEGTAEITVTASKGSASDTKTVTIEIKEPAIVKVEPETSSHKVGESFNIDIRIESVTDLGLAGFDLNLTFDATVLEATNVSEGDFLKKDGADTYSVKPTLDNKNGKVTCGVVRTTAGGASGDGTLATITFKGKAKGTSKLTLQVVLSDPSGQKISTKIVDGSVTIDDGNHCVDTLKVSGVVTNKDGKPVKDAKVLVRNEKNGKEQSASTDSSGKYSITFLEPGSCMAAVSDKMNATAATADGLKGCKSYILTADDINATKVRIDIEVPSECGPIPEYEYKMELYKGFNLIAVPLDPGKTLRLSDLAKEIGDKASFFIWRDVKVGAWIAWEPGFNDPEGPEDKVIKGGDGIIVLMTGPAEITFKGVAWSNAPILIKDDFILLEGFVFENGKAKSLDNVSVGIANLCVGQPLIAQKVTSARAGRLLVLLSSPDTNSAIISGDALEMTLSDKQIGSGCPIQISVTPEARESDILHLGEIQWRPIPKMTQLLANYPNPFNPETWIPYKLSESANVTIQIYSVTGKLIRTLSLGQKPAGEYILSHKAAYWDGKDDAGEQVASGVYFYSLKAGKYMETRKMLLLK